jgi:sugar lactone lactonase YvrE
MRAARNLCLSRRSSQILIVVVVLWSLLHGPSRLINDAHAGVTQASAKPAVTTSSTPSPKFTAIYTALPSLNTLGVYPISSNGNVPSIVGNTFISNPGGIAYWAGRLYVTNLAKDSITVYPAGANGSISPIVTIQGENTSLDSPTAITFDSNGNIYVANAGKGGGGHDSITKYAAGSSGDVAPVAEITGAHTQLSSPTGIALDSSGDIYVANQSPTANEPDSITVYSPNSAGNAAPIRVISGALTKLSSLSGIAIDSSGNIYASSLGVEGSSGADILIFAAGSNGNVAPIFEIDGDCAGLKPTGPIALDASANIYVGGYDKLAFFAHVDLRMPNRPCLTPGFAISGPKTGISQITGVAVDSVGDIFVTDSDSNSVRAFQSGDNGDVEPSATIATHNDIFAPTAVALDSSGKIYVVNGAADRQVSDTVTIYAPGSNAATAPIASIGWDYKGTDKAHLSGPFAVAIDKEGKVYVANQASGYNGDGSITVYVPGSAGNAAPVAEISGTKTGDKTGLNSPIGIAVDAASKLYVLNEFGADGGSITIYPPGANGNVGPEATISDSATGHHTQLNSPAGLALDTAGDIYVTNESNSITIYAAGSKGDIAPKATISGSNTGLATPRGIAIDNNGNIYVANASDGVVTDEDEDDSNTGRKQPATITVYPPGSDGNVKPIATIAGSLTSLAHPEGIAIGPADLTPQRSKALAFSDWSVTASPNLASQPPSREVVDRFMLSVQASVTDSFEFGRVPEKLLSYKFADLRHDGFLSLVAATGSDSTGSCNDFHNGGFCSVYIVDKTVKGFQIYKTFGSIEDGGSVPLGVQDLQHDGNLEVVINQRFAWTFKQCVASWPATYAWTGDGYMNVSDRFKDFYRSQLDTLNKLIPILPQSGPSFDQRDKECLEAEVAKIERVLGSPNAGLDTAIAFTKSNDPIKIVFGMLVLTNIDTPQAQQYFNTLPNSPDPNIQRFLKQLADPRGKEMTKAFSQFERLR